LAAHLERPEHGERVGKVRVHAAHPSRFGTRRLGIEVHHLGARVYAAVGAAGASGAYGVAGDFTQRGLESVLDRSAARLCLPAEKATAVVPQSEGDTQGP